MKAISLWGPWGSLIFDLRKRHETRHWWTPHRGPIAIHQAKRVDADACALFGYLPQEVPRGAMLGVVDLEDCIRMTPALIDRQPEQEYMAGNWAIGRYAWPMRVIERFATPIPAVGRQGLFEWNP